MFASAARKRVHAYSRFCVEFLLGPALELAEDATPAVRLRAAGLLPALKRAVRLPDDVAALEGLNSALAKLQVGWRSLGSGLRVVCLNDVATLEGPQQRDCQAANSISS